VLNTEPSRVIYRCGSRGAPARWEVGSKSGPGDGLYGFREYEDHMFWTRTMQTWSDQEALKNDCLLEFYLDKLFL